MRTDRMRQAAWNTVVLAAIGVAAVLGTGAVPWPDNDRLFSVYQNIQVFGRVYKEVATNYVDAVDPEKFMQAGIAGMLETLDPYTSYIAREEGDEVDLLTTGKYGGIGVTIGVRDGQVQIISVMDGYSAQRAGIQAGDVILKVDSVDVVSKKADEVRNLARGEAGTEIHLTVRREGSAAPLDFVLVREEIQVKNVTYAGYLEPGIGYIRLERFSRKAGEEVRQAIRDLRGSGELKGLVLDLRGNPGGLLDAAVEVVSKFVPRGSLVVTTKGRRPETDKSYSSAEEPLAPDLPLVVVTNEGSASASEIVCGSLQDMDRAVIVGTRTFGKGLVQTIVPLEYGAQLKITTARYYIPSGRSIQEIDYMHRDRSGVFLVTPDSLRHEFRTKHGRKVLDAGGIMPDSVVKDDDPGPYVRELYRKALFFKFSNRYIAEHRGAPVTAPEEQTLEAFRKFLEAEHFDYQEDAEVKLAELKKMGEQSHYGDEVQENVRRLAAALERERKRGFDRYRDHIQQALALELMGRAKGEQGRIEASLGRDEQLKVAREFLKNQKLYTRKLSS
jgi:carboxyl-terminal processing protease